MSKYQVNPRPVQTLPERWPMFFPAGVKGLTHEPITSQASYHRDPYRLTTPACPSAPPFDYQDAYPGIPGSTSIPSALGRNFEQFPAWRVSRLPSTTAARLATNQHNSVYMIQAIFNTATLFTLAQDRGTRVQSVGIICSPCAAAAPMLKSHFSNPVMRMPHDHYLVSLLPTDIFLVNMTDESAVKLRWPGGDQGSIPLIPPNVLHGNRLLEILHAAVLAFAEPGLLWLYPRNEPNADMDPRVSPIELYLDQERTLPNPLIANLTSLSEEERRDWLRSAQRHAGSTVPETLTVANYLRRYNVVNSLPSDEHDERAIQAIDAAFYHTFNTGLRGRLTPEQRCILFLLGIASVPSYTLLIGAFISKLATRCRLNFVTHPDPFPEVEFEQPVRFEFAPEAVVTCIGIGYGCDRFNWAVGMYPVPVASLGTRSPSDIYVAFFSGDNQREMLPPFVAAVQDKTAEEAKQAIENPQPGQHAFGYASERAIRTFLAALGQLPQREHRIFKRPRPGWPQLAGND